MTTLSACLIVKNEAENIKRCLESLREHVDQIVVLDTGSDDGKPGIALDWLQRNSVPYEFRCSLYFLPSTPADDFDFAKARNEALDLCTCDWVLSIDADEELVITDGDAFREGLDITPYDSTVVTITGEIDGQTVHRLFRRDPAIRWKGPIHEGILVESPFKTNPTPPNFISLHHHGASATPGKRRRNYALLKKWFYELGVRRYLYYLCGEADMAGQYAECLGYAIAYRNFRVAEQPEDPVMDWTVKTWEAKAYMRLEAFGTALEIAEQCIVERPEFADGYVIRGDALANMQRWNEARASYMKCIHLDAPKVHPLGYIGRFYDASEILCIVNQVDVKEQQAKNIGAAA